MLSFCANCWEYLDEQVSGRIRVQLRGFSSGKESACQCRGQSFNSWFRKIPHAVEQLSPWALTTESMLWSPGDATTEAPCSRNYSATREVTTKRNSHITTAEGPTQQQKHCTAKNKIQINKIIFKTQT